MFWLLIVGCGRGTPAEAPVEAPAALGGEVSAGVGDEFEEDLRPRDPLDDAPTTGPEGAWVDHHADGSVKTRGSFVDGLRSGAWERLGPDGTVLVSGRFEGGEAVGAWHWRWPGGAKQQQGEYVGGLAAGTWSVWRPDGSLFEQMDHAGGVPHGPWRIYHPNGRVAEVMTWRAGLQEGQHVDWSDAGVRLAEGSFEEGRPVGTWTCFDGELPRSIPAPPGRATPAEACGIRAEVE